MYPEWRCPRCQNASSSARIYTEEYGTELEVTCQHCGLRWYPDNIHESGTIGKIVSEKVKCPNCSGQAIKQTNGIATCALCGFRWNLKEFAEAERMEREEAANFKQRREENISGAEYEELVAESLSRKGFHSISMTKRSGDKGADILATTSSGITVVIQCKRYSGSVGQVAVQEAVSAREYYHCQRAIVVTNSTFTPTAIDYAKHTNTSLIEKYLTEQCKRKAQF